MLDISDQIIADLEQQVYKLKCEVRDLKDKPSTIIEVPVAGTVTLEEYQRVCTLYQELLDDTLPF